ncbi:MAG: radical SAM protein [Fervidobacterium sp.]
MESNISNVNISVNSPIGISPSKTLSVTVTKSCPFKCAHCNSHYLEHMVHIDELIKSIDEHVKKYSSFLISGGMLLNGEIPFGPYLEKLREMKRKYNIKYNFHVGFPKRVLYELEDVADVISFDFYADSGILMQVYGIERTPEDILNVIMPLNVKKVPHITVGIMCGKITHEYKALEILSKYFKSVVLNVFIPTSGTKFENCTPPSLEDVEQVFQRARGYFEQVVLGCMQPRGEYRSHLQILISKYTDFVVKPVNRQYSHYSCCSFYTE